GATIAFPSARAICSAQYSVAYLCSPIAMCGPFCSVPAVPMIAVVLPFWMSSASSSQVSSSRKTVSGGLGVGSWADAIDADASAMMAARAVSVRVETNRGMDRGIGEVGYRFDVAQDRFGG